MFIYITNYFLRLQQLPGDPRQKKFGRLWRTGGPRMEVFASAVTVNERSPKTPINASRSKILVSRGGVLQGSAHKSRPTSGGSHPLNKNLKGAA